MPKTTPVPERQKQILSLLVKDNRLSVNEVAEQFSISHATARRDLASLASQGKARRVHGGAIAVGQIQPPLPMLERASEQAYEKANIGLKASELVSEGASVFLGSGTTVLEVARNLLERKLTIITNSLPVLNLLAKKQNITMICLGGSLRASELSFIGHIAEQALAELHADCVIIGARAISAERGLTNDCPVETFFYRAVLNSGREIIVVADHTKCGLISPLDIAPLKAVQTLVTDSRTDVGYINALRQKGVNVVVA